MASYVQRACDSISEFEQRYEKFSKLLIVRQLAAKTIVNYCSKIATICLVYGKLPENLSEEDIANYFSSLLLRTPLPASSQFVHVAAGLRCYYKLMGFPAKYISVPVVKKRKKLPVVLSGDEIRKLLESTKDIRQKLMLTLIYSLGLRVGELCRLEVSDVDMGRMRVHIRQSKGGKDRYLPLSPISLPLLKRYMNSYYPVKYLINGARVGDPAIQREVSLALYAALIRIDCQKHITCHNLRHTFAVHALENGTSLMRLKELLGHSHIQATLIYLQVANLEDRPFVNPLDIIFSKKG